MKNLRESTSHEKVVAYHRQFYRAENLCLIVTGNIDEKKIFASLANIEKRISDRNASLSPFLRPWQESVPAFTTPIVLDVPYPCDDEDNGIVEVAWRGPSAKTQIYAFFATVVLMEYLTESAISPLQSAFVETEDPYASS